MIFYVTLCTFLNTTEKKSFLYLGKFWAQKDHKSHKMKQLLYSKTQWVIECKIWECPLFILSKRLSLRSNNHQETSAHKHHEMGGNSSFLQTVRLATGEIKRGWGAKAINLWSMGVWQCSSSSIDS